MGLRDKYNRLTSAQAVSATIVCTDSFALPATGVDIAIGEPMALRFSLSAVSAVAGTLQFQVVTATASDGTTGQVIISTTEAITDTTLAAGSTITVPIPPGQIRSTATHLTGRVVIASSGTCTMTVDLIPLMAGDNIKMYDAQPALQ
jgi:hypothetical protein